MAQDFKINGSIIARITKINWNDAVDSEALNGKTRIDRWRKLSVEADVLAIADWATVYALEGTKVSVTCTDYSNKNATDYVTYYDVDFDAIAGRHIGPNVEGVRMDFLVRM